MKSKKEEVQILNFSENDLADKSLVKLYKSLGM